MVTISVNRHTGEARIVGCEPSPDDQPIAKLAAIIADWAIKTGEISPEKKGA